MDIENKTASMTDIWWAAGREFVYLPTVDPAFAPQNMGGLRRFLLRALALPASYRRSDWKRILQASDQRAGYLFARQRGASLHIDALGVEPDFRRQGLARNLLAEAEAYARQEELEYLTAGLTPQNEPAEKLLVGEGFRPFRTTYFAWSGELLETAGSPGFELRELSPAETLPAFERWQQTVFDAGDAWAADLLLDVYRRSGWKGAARHWACLAGGEDVGYLRVAGLRGRYQAYLACAENYWGSNGQVAWLHAALASYPTAPEDVTLDLAGDRQTQESQVVWAAAGFDAQTRNRYLVIKPLGPA